MRGGRAWFPAADEPESVTAGSRYLGVLQRPLTEPSEASFFPPLNQPNSGSGVAYFLVMLRAWGCQASWDKRKMGPEPFDRSTRSLRGPARQELRHGRRGKPCRCQSA